MRSFIFRDIINQQNEKTPRNTVKKRCFRGVLLFFVTNLLLIQSSKHTVYVHTDIQKVETDHNGKAVEDLFSYHEVQYSKDEYLDLMMKENAALKESITDTQIALCEIYESMGG